MALHSIVPLPKDKSFLYEARGRHRKGTLPSAMNAWLEQEHGIHWIEFRDSSKRGAWQARAQSALDHFRSHSRLPRMRSSDANEEKLGIWLMSQRGLYRRGRLLPERNAWLDTHLPGWADTKDQIWINKGNEVAKFEDANRRLPSRSASDPTEIALGRWIEIQRSWFAMGKLREDRLAWLGDNLPNWKAPETLWQEKAEAVRRIHEEIGRFPSADTGNSETKVLGTWLQAQRTLLKQGALREDRSSWLDEHIPGWGIP